MYTKTTKIAGKTVQLVSNDGVNWSTNPNELQGLEDAANTVEPESPYWDIKPKNDEILEDALDILD